jgi:hypothetical protein
MHRKTTYPETDIGVLQSLATEVAVGGVPGPQRGAGVISTPNYTLDKRLVPLLVERGGLGVRVEQDV